MVRLHGLSRVIVFDRGTKFTSGFWREVCRVMGTVTPPTEQCGIAQYLGRERDGFPQRKDYIINNRTD